MIKIFVYPTSLAPIILQLSSNFFQALPITLKDKLRPLIRNISYYKLHCNVYLFIHNCFKSIELRGIQLNNFVIFCADQDSLHEFKEKCCCFSVDEDLNLYTKVGEKITGG